MRSFLTYPALLAFSGFAWADPAAPVAAGIPVPETIAKTTKLDFSKLTTVEP